MKILLLVSALFLLTANFSFAKTAPIKKTKEIKQISQLDEAITTKTLLQKFSKEYASKEELQKLKTEVLELKGNAVFGLIQVMKDSKYPEKNRWMATFLLGQIMGIKSAPFIAKFLEHPDWIMRLSALKTLLALKQVKYGAIYAKLLKDDSLLVRYQALENIRALSLTKYAPSVWAMLYDKKNYYSIKNKNKRSSIIKNVITTVGELEFSQARPILLKMVQKEKYADIFNELDYSLSRITKKPSPVGGKKAKKEFWSRIKV